MNHETAQALAMVARATLVRDNIKASGEQVWLSPELSTESEETFAHWLKAELQAKPVGVSSDELQTLARQVFDSAESVEEHWLSEDLHCIGSQLTRCAYAVERRDQES